MCGILFILWTKQIPTNRRSAVLHAIKDVVASRGPEAYNHVSVESVDMVFHRLATYGDLNA